MSIKQQKERLYKNELTLSKCKSLDEALDAFSQRKLTKVDTNLYDVYGWRFGENENGFYFYRTIASPN